MTSPTVSAGASVQVPARTTVIGRLPDPRSSPEWRDDASVHVAIVASVASRAGYSCSMARSTKSDAPEPTDPAALRRETAGRYVTADGRFTVEKGSGGWMMLDAEQSDDLGLPLVRGPYGTLDEARAAVAEARLAPPPSSDLAERLAAQATRDRGSGDVRSRSGASPKAASKSERPPEPPPPPPVVVREFQGRDGDQLRALWKEAGLGSAGDDDAGLRRFAAKNPGLLLVAAQGDRIVASALGGWDGRRGWIYHVATAASHRRSGLATRLVRQIEAKLATIGAPRVNVLVGSDNRDGLRLWKALGYAERPTRQYARDLDAPAAER